MKISPITADLITSLFPDSISLIPKVKNPFYFPDTKPNSVSGLLYTIWKIQSFQMQLKIGTGYNPRAQTTINKYGHYLQFPNNRIKDLAYSIVNRTDSNDEKAHKILMWVHENIPYETDLENYKIPEYWALPTLTLNKGSGDCEDQSFLIHSLMLNAGVPYEKIKTFGGLVYVGPRAPSGGHGWTVYQRESDNEWVVLDSTYYFTDAAINDRTPLKDDLRYQDDFFYVTAIETRDATFYNYLRGARVNTIA